MFIQCSDCDYKYIVNSAVKAILKLSNIEPDISSKLAFVNSAMLQVEDLK